LFVGREADGTVAELDVAVEDASGVHEFEAGDLVEVVSMRFQLWGGRRERTSCIAIQQTLLKSILSFPLFLNSESKLGPSRSIAR
jgi:hypothetical protein